MLNSYIDIFSTTKYQNVPCNSGAKAIFFWLHSYSAQPLLVVHYSWKDKNKLNKIKIIILCSHCFYLSHHYFSVSLLMSTMHSYYFWLWLCFGG